MNHTISVHECLDLCVLSKVRWTALCWLPGHVSNGDADEPVETGQCANNLHESKYGFEPPKLTILSACGRRPYPVDLDA